MRPVIVSLLLAGACLAGMTSAAQPGVPVLAPSRAVECMTPTLELRGKPVYPENALESKLGGHVRVELVFKGPDEAPFVNVIEPNVWDGLITAVRDHVKAFRVPCMKAGEEPVRLIQDYVFSPNDGRKVMASRPRDAADAARWDQLRCLMRITPGTLEFPTRVLREGKGGNVVVGLRFTTPTDAPEVTILAAAQERLLVRSVEKFVAGYRLPCLTAGPVSTNFVFRFHIVDDPRVTLKDLPLAALLTGAKDLPRGTYFDTSTMNCPFDVRLTYYRPHSSNDVREVESSNAARAPLLDWLADLTLNLDARTNTALLGDTLNVSVPCVKIDL